MLRSLSRFALLLVSVLSVLPILSVSARAETVSFGLLLGPAIQSEGGTALGFELKGGYRFLPAIATNLYYWHVSTGAEVNDGISAISSNTTLSSFGVEALYGFPGSNWSAGAKLGLMKNAKEGSAISDTSTVGVSSSASSLALAPTVVYEVPLSFMMVGAEAAYFYSLSSSVSKALSLMVEGRVRF